MVVPGRDGENQSCSFEMIVVSYKSLGSWQTWSALLMSGGHCCAKTGHE